MWNMIASSNSSFSTPVLKNISSCILAWSTIICVIIYIWSPPVSVYCRLYSFCILFTARSYEISNTSSVLCFESFGAVTFRCCNLPYLAAITYSAVWGLLTTICWVIPNSHSLIPLCPVFCFVRLTAWLDIIGAACFSSLPSGHIHELEERQEVLVI